MEHWLCIQCSLLSPLLKQHFQAGWRPTDPQQVTCSSFGANAGKHLYECLGQGQNDDATSFIKKVKIAQNPHMKNIFKGHPVYTFSFSTLYNSSTCSPLVHYVGGSCETAIMYKSQQCCLYCTTSTVSLLPSLFYYLGTLTLPSLFSHASTQPQTLVQHGQS
jgi:hypothetical protein